MVFSCKTDRKFTMINYYNLIIKKYNNSSYLFHNSWELSIGRHQDYFQWNDTAALLQLHFHVCCCHSLTFINKRKNFIIHKSLKMTNKKQKRLIKNKNKERKSQNTRPHIKSNQFQRMYTFGNCTKHHDFIFLHIINE